MEELNPRLKPVEIAYSSGGNGSFQWWKYVIPVMEMIYSSGGNVLFQWWK